VTPDPARLHAAYFDGRTARAHPVVLWVHAGTLHVEGEGIALAVPVRRVRWPERQRHGERHAQLPDDGLISTADAAAWDAWAGASRFQPEGLTVRWMQSWRAVLGALVLTLVVLGAGYRWGLPAAAQRIAALLPAQVHQQVGTAALEGFRDQWLVPSRIDPAAQAALRQQFAQAVARTPAFAAAAPAWTLHFHASPKKGIGPNAFALPGGHIVVTDELVDLLKDRPDVLIGVLGHELGHVQHHHGMRSLVQASALAAVSALVLGDISTVLTAAPVLLGQAAYARGFEHEADLAAAQLMRANGWDPGGFELLFQRLGQWQSGRGPGIELPIGLSTHPPDAERVRHMREAAAR
jgi:Zn-dependent protease with chaperone function